MTSLHHDNIWCAFEEMNTLPNNALVQNPDSEIHDLVGSTNRERKDELLRLIRVLYMQIHLL